MCIRDRNSIVSGFEATGLSPHNVERPLSKLPEISTACHDRQGIREDLDASLIEMLKERRGHTNNKKRTRGKKFTPGQEVVLEENDEPSCTHEIAANFDDDICASCFIQFHRSSGPDWIQCQSCDGWICGRCNRGTYDPTFVCAQCVV